MSDQTKPDISTQPREDQLLMMFADFNAEVEQFRRSIDTRLVRLERRTASRERAKAFFDPENILMVALAAVAAIVAIRLGIYFYAQIRAKGVLA